MTAITQACHDVRASWATAADQKYFHVIREGFVSTVSFLRSFDDIQTIGGFYVWQIAMSNRFASWRQAEFWNFCE
jgi:hypothetical protein